MNNWTNLAYALVRTLNVKVTYKTVKETMLSHPDYPSLLSLKEALELWDIETASLRLQTGQLCQQLPQLPTPFLAQVRSQSDDLFSEEFVLVHTINESQVHWTNNWEIGNLISNYRIRTKKKHVEPIDQFAFRTTGIVMLAQTRTSSGETNYHISKASERMTLVRAVVLYIMCLISVLLMASRILQLPVSDHWYGIIGIKLAGMVVTGVLVGQTINGQSALVNRLCQIHKSFDCHAALESKAAMVWEGLTWSEAGFFYFCSGLLLSFFYGNNPLGVPIVLILNLSALPVTFFLIYYQKRVLGKWCLLCLTVMVLLWIESAYTLLYWPQAFYVLIHSWFIFTDFQWYDYQWRELDLLFLSFLLPVVGWLLARPYLRIHVAYKALKNRLKQFQTNPDLFEYLLSQQPVLPSLQAVHPLCIGSDKAENTLTIITNPFCSPCAKAHGAMDTLLEMDRIKCQIIFSVSEDNDEKRNILAYYILSLPKNEQLSYLREWFNKSESDKELALAYIRSQVRGKAIQRPLSSAHTLESAHTLAVNSDEAYSDEAHLKNRHLTDQTALLTIKMHRQWCKKAGITATPTVYVNQHRLPDMYRIEDLRVLLPQLSFKKAAS